MAEIPALVGVSEAAEILGVSKQRVAQLRERPDFPAMVQKLQATPLWREADVRTFAEQRSVSSPGSSEAVDRA